MYEIFKRVVNNEDLANLEQEVSASKQNNDKKLQFIQNYQVP